MEPPVFRHAFAGVLLVAVNAAIHSAGTLLALWRTLKRRSWILQNLGYLQITLVLTIVVAVLLALHLIEMTFWALYYDLKGCLPDLLTCIYFSMITYTTVGYGDVVLNEEWRLLGGVEALAGVLMLSWSTALLVGLVSWIYTHMLDLWGAKKSD